MKKPINFIAKIFTEFVGDVNEENSRYDLICDICKQYNFHVDYDGGTMFFQGTDVIYELLESRVIFILKALKKEKFIVVVS